MKIIDISWPITSAMTAYKDRKIVDVAPTKQFDKDNVRESRITIGSHSGTHLDAPAHFLKDGLAIDQISLDRLTGTCVVVDMELAGDTITAEDCAHQDIAAGDIVLFKTINSSRDTRAAFDPDFTYLDQSAAAYLAEKKVKAVGIDYLGIERNQPAHETHLTLMHADVLIIEGLRLMHVEPGRYFFVCLPLLVVGCDGAPARAILIEGM